MSPAGSERGQATARTTGMRRRGGGFTLLELVLAVFIMAAAVAVSIPSLSRGRSSLSLHAAGRDMVNVMRYAREKAITGVEEVHVVIDRENQKVVLVSQSGEGERSMALPRHVRVEKFARFGEVIDQGPWVVRFLPNGSAEAAEVLLQADNGSTLRIATDPITGGAKVLRPGGADNP